MDVLHVSPHPDDELIGAPATLMALRDEGDRIVNFAASLGAPESAERRRAELEEACRRAGFELVVTAEPLGGMSGNSAVDREASEQRVADALAGVLEHGSFGLVVSPSPHDRHPAHRGGPRERSMAARTAEAFGPEGSAGLAVEARRHVVGDRAERQPATRGGTGRLAGAVVNVIRRGSCYPRPSRPL